MRYLLGFLLFIISNPAVAEECSQVLRDGTKKSSNWSNNFVSTQIAYSLFQSSDMTNRQESKASEWGISYGPWSANNKRSKSLNEAYNRQLSKLNINYLNDTQQVQGAISSGDSIVVDAWLACMKNKQGLVAYFLNTSAKSATLVIKWVRDPSDPDAASSTTLKNTVTFPSWMVPVETDGPRCWKIPTSRNSRNGDGLIDVGGCSVRFDLDPTQFRESAHMRIDTYRGGAEVFLPPRVRYLEESRTVLAEGFVDVPVVHNWVGVLGSTLHKMNQADVDEGWIFDPTSFLNGSSSVGSVSLHKKWGRSCGGLLPTDTDVEEKNPVTVTDNEVLIGARGMFRHHGTPREFLKCKLTGSIRMFRIREIPII